MKQILYFAISGKLESVFRKGLDSVILRLKAGVFGQNRALQCRLLASLTIMEHLWVPMCVLTICSCNTTKKYKHKFSLML